MDRAAATPARDAAWQAEPPRQPRRHSHRHRDLSQFIGFVIGDDRHAPTGTGCQLQGG
jgi:hypothetical protein